MDLKTYTTGIQHIGIPTNDIEKTIAFYQKLGFEIALQTVNEEADEKVAFPVLGDAERIFVVEYQDTTIDISQGNIDLKSTHKQIVDIMEGGEEAFDKRQLIYTSWK